MASCEQEVQIRLVFWICWNPEAAGFNTSEGMDILVPKSKTYTVCDSSVAQTYQNSMRAESEPA